MVDLEEGLKGSRPDLINHLNRLAYGALPGSGRVAATFLALLLLAWPMCSFVALFAFDSPIKSPLDEMFRYALVFSVWGYPLLYGIGLGGARLVARRTRVTWKILLPFAIPAFTPFLIFLNFNLPSR